MPRRREKRGEGKPETFIFWVSPTCVGRATDLAISRQTEDYSANGWEPNLKEIHAKLRQRMHENPRKTVAGQVVVRGYFQYHAIPGNEERLRAFFAMKCWRNWLRTLRRRSQRSTGRGSVLESPWSQATRVKILHPYPTERFDAKHPSRNRCVSRASTGLCGGVG